MGDVVNADKIALLEPVLEDHGWTAVQKTGGKNRKHSGVGVRKCLVGPVSVKKPQCDGGNIVGMAGDQAEALLIVFGEGVDRGGGGDFCFGRWNRHQRRPQLVLQFPTTQTQLFERALWRRLKLLAAAAVE